jgi:hypothetical protein
MYTTVHKMYTEESMTNSQKSITNQKDKEEQRNQAIRYVAELLCAGIPRSAMLEHLKEDKGWSVSRRTIDNYCREAGKLLATEAKVNVQGEIAKSMRRIEHIYRSCLDAHDLTGALSAEKERIRLLGLAAAEKLDVRQAVAVIRPKGYEGIE